MEVDYLPEFVEDIREETGRAARRFQGILRRAHELAETSHIGVHPHVLTGHPVRDVVRLAAEIKADLLVIGATGHSALYERLIGSRADRMVQLAQCAVLVVK
jgi:nucleotide-binding universal stress UspA family protein